MAWSLFIQLCAVLASGVALAALALLLGPSLLDPVGTLAYLTGVLAGVCGIELAEVLVAVVFLVGFHHLHAGRHEYGLPHARSLGRATACVALFAALTVFSTAYTIASNSLVPTAPGLSTGLILTGNLALAPIDAGLAGLALLFSVGSVADATHLRRLRSGLVLGIAGAAAGPALLAFGSALSPHDVSGISSGLLAAAVAGEGISALSLLVFFLAFRGIRRELAAGRPAPVLPRYAPAYPWAWAPREPAAPQAPMDGQPPKP